MRDRRPESEANVKAIGPRKEGENQPPRTVLGCRRQRLNAQARGRGAADRLDCRVANILGGKSSVIPWGFNVAKNLDRAFSSVSVILSPPSRRAAFLVNFFNDRKPRSS
jgi:hypothetical protein